MKFITLTYTNERTVIEYFINCDKIHLIANHGGLYTWVNFGDSEAEFKVDQTPQEILWLIQREQMNNNKQNSVDKEFVPYAEALALKELGFDEKCLCNWEESWSPKPEHEIRMVLTTDQTWLRPGWICAPTFSQAFRFFREKHNLHYFIDVSDGVWFFDRWSFDGYKTYEEAELACLRKLIEIVQGGNNEQQ